MEVVQEIVAALTTFSQPFIDAEVRRVLDSGGRLRFDGDLTGLPVSSGSTTYPNVAYGHMADEVRLGYQAALVSMESPSYGRLWLSVAHHPGDTVSSTQMEAMVQAAEEAVGRRPRRRTELLHGRVKQVQEQVAAWEQQVAARQSALTVAQERLAEAEEQLRERQAVCLELEGQYRLTGRTVTPHSRLAQARSRLHAGERRVQSRRRQVEQAQRRLEKTRSKLHAQQAELDTLQQRLRRLEAENAANPHPVAAEFRVDAGFGTYDNVAYLIEMGYEVYTKPYSHRVVEALRRRTAEETSWTRVGANAEMAAWSQVELGRCPYPLDVALERFYVGQNLKYSALLHYGSDPVLDDLPGWFKHYNRRQTIEAGIKEGKQVFYLHKIKVRSEPAIVLQEAFTLFAANFIRWATEWLDGQAEPASNALALRREGIKRQVQVVAHVAARIERTAGGWLLKFSRYSVFAGKELFVPDGFSPPWSSGESCMAESSGFG